MYRVTQPLKGPGQVRSLGSIAMELAYVAAGLFHYTAFGPARLWDVAAGVLLVHEAGGLVLTRPRRHPWQPVDRFQAPQGKGTELERLSRWRLSPMIAASPDLAWNVSRGLRLRARPLSWLLRLLAQRNGRRRG
jgi:fructose-1,6-bisphosphatase/inositol monophosphatase family enzyme